LFLSLDSQQRVVANLGSCISRSVGILQRHETLRACILLQLLMFRALDEVVDATLSQQVCFCFLRRTGLSVVGTLVHPVHAIDLLLAACGLELTLDFFLCALLFDLVEALLGSLAFGEGLLLFIPDSLLVAPQRGMERLFQVEIAAAHFDDVEDKFVWLIIEVASD
jgi:hypothetical protein